MVKHKPVPSGSVLGVAEGDVGVVHCVPAEVGTVKQGVNNEEEGERCEEDRELCLPFVLGVTVQRRPLSNDCSRLYRQWTTSQRENKGLCAIGQRVVAQDAPANLLVL